MNKYLSLGLGVQSTALYYMASKGELPSFDAAIFIDLGKEKKKTYDYLEYLLAWKKENNGLPIHVVQRKNLFQDLLNQVNTRGSRFASIPAYTKNEDGSTGMLRRQCTGEYKIAQVDRYIREVFYDLKPKKRMLKTEIWKGISMDEAERLRLSEQVWKTHVYPFCNYIADSSSAIRITWGKKMTRTDIINWYISQGLPIPPKSSCTFCPYTSEFAWAKMKKKDPKDFEAAILVDRAIRNSSKKGIHNPIYLHGSCIPLEDVVFVENAIHNPQPTCGVRNGNMEDGIDLRRTRALWPAPCRSWPECQEPSRLVPGSAPAGNAGPAIIDGGSGRTRALWPAPCRSWPKCQQQALLVPGSAPAGRSGRTRARGPPPCRFWQGCPQRPA